MHAARQGGHSGKVHGYLEARQGGHSGKVHAGTFSACKVCMPRASSIHMRSTSNNAQMQARGRHAEALAHAKTLARAETLAHAETLEHRADMQRSLRAEP
eukprot:364965-Chlamydomonas_euryale.AAC.17